MKILITLLLALPLLACATPDTPEPLECIPPAEVPTVLEDEPCAEAWALRCSPGVALMRCDGATWRPFVLCYSLCSHVDDGIACD